MKILGTGLNGLVGSRIVEILPQFEFINVSRSTGVDITNYFSLAPVFESFKGDYVLHLAAKADVDGCEQDRAEKENGEAWKINVIGTSNIVEFCKKYNKKLIYISTDFVFDGEKPLGEAYTEEDKPFPINWYGETKYEGEKKINDSGVENTILRISYPYGVSSAVKKDFVRIIAQRLLEGKEIKGVTDHIMCPTYIDDIAETIKLVAENNIGGLYHAVGASHLSPYEAALMIARQVGVNPDTIGKTTREEYFQGKAKRPFNLYLKNDKIRTLGASFRSFGEALLSMQLH